jgi:hypothetical protein
MLRFYEETLGLLRQPDRKVEYGPGPEPDDESVRAIMGLGSPGEYYVTTNFDDPRSSTDVQKYRSGRLHIQRFPPDAPTLPNLSREIRPGCLGPCLYTLRMREAARVHRRVTEAAGTSEVSGRVLRNEFGEPAFCFASPDGYMWSGVEC